MNVLLSNENFIMFAMKAYNNPRCYNISEFHDDLNHIKYLKRLLRRYNEKRTLTPLQLRLILNHLIIIFNVFDIDWAVRILFFKMEKPNSGPTGRFSSLVLLFSLWSPLLPWCYGPVLPAFSWLLILGCCIELCVLLKRNINDKYNNSNTYAHILFQQRKLYIVVSDRVP